MSSILPLQKTCQHQCFCTRWRLLPFNQHWCLVCQRWVKCMAPHLDWQDEGGEG